MRQRFAQKKTTAADAPRPSFVVHSGMAHHLERKSSPNRHATISQIFQQPCSRHDTAMLRVESKNDSDSTILHS
jgi:hypothetical protein